MENLISKAKLFLEAYTKAHPVLCTSSEKDVACYLAYHELKNAIKEQEEKSIIDTTKQQLQQADVSGNEGAVCDCTHTQACENCAESKDIDWSLIAPKKQTDH